MKKSGSNRAVLRLAGILLLFALTVGFVWLMPRRGY